MNDTLLRLLLFYSAVSVVSILWMAGGAAVLFLLSLVGVKPSIEMYLVSVLSFSHTCLIWFAARRLWRRL